MPADAPPFCLRQIRDEAPDAFAGIAMNFKNGKPAPEDRRGFQMNNRLSAP